MQLSFLDDAAVTAEFSIRESARARRMSIRVHPPGTVEVVVPRRTRAGEVQAFVLKHRDWIDRTRRSMLPAGGMRGLPERIELELTGGTREVTYLDRGGAAVKVDDDGLRLTVTADRHREGRIRDALKEWLRGRARELLPPRLDALSRSHGLEYKRVQIRAQRSRWGSCSAKKTISLNCALVLLPSDLVRYLLIHELCHTRYLDHSRRFWAAVARCEPDFRVLDRRLGEAWASLPAWILLR
jgi:predicted metal-dependent hydrolase